MPGGAKVQQPAGPAFGKPPGVALQKLDELVVLFKQVSFVERLAFFVPWGPSNAP